MRELQNLIKRDESCLTNEKVTKLLVSIKDVPVFFGCVETDGSSDLKTSMDFFIEKSTGLIQLNNLIPLEVLYQTQHAFGVGSIWDFHYESFANFISKDKHSKIIEIGGATDRLAIKFLNNNKVQWTIVEPNPSENISKEINVLRGFFEDSDISIDKSDTIVFSHVLEHAYSPDLFLKKIYNKLNFGQELYFSYPRLEIWLDKKFTNALNFEHTVFLTESHLDVLLENTGFNIEMKDYFLDHSIFYRVSKINKKPTLKKYPNLYKKHKQLFNSYIEYHNKEVFKLNQLMNDSNSVFFLFGAHIFSQFLIVLGLNTDKIHCILDNSKEKQGKRLYGTNLKVKSPRILKNVENPIIILKAANYNDEIRDDILKNVHPNAKFI